MADGSLSNGSSPHNHHSFTPNCPFTPGSLRVGYRPSQYIGMRFNPQSNFVPETEVTQVAPIVAQPPVLGVRSPLKTAVVIIVIGFAAGGAMWLWSEGVPGQNKANGDTTKSSVIDESIIQYAEAVISGHSEADRVKAVPGESIESRLRGGRRSSNLRALDEYRSGKLAMGMGKHKQAAVHFEEAIRIDPNFTDAHYRLGLAYVRIGNFRAARRQQAFLKQLHDDRANLLGHLVDN